MTDVDDLTDLIANPTGGLRPDDIARRIVAAGWSRTPTEFCAMGGGKSTCQMNVRSVEDETFTLPWNEEGKA
jgi:hypothetical protein